MYIMKKDTIFCVVNLNNKNVLGGPMRLTEDQEIFESTLIETIFCEECGTTHALIHLFDDIGMYTEIEVCDESLIAA